MKLTWVEISRDALLSNARVLRACLSPGVKFCVAVKANAYGHGLVEVARVLEEAPGSVDWLGVNSLEEAAVLRGDGLKLPIYVMGFVPDHDLEAVFGLDVRMVVYHLHAVKRLEEIGEQMGEKIFVHLKLETGNHRQGVYEEELESWIEFFKESRFVILEGLSTHFSNIEDSDDPAYARMQMERMARGVARFEAAGISVPVIHQANSAATILFPETHGTMVRSGIALYGLWPSEGVRKSVEQKSGKSDIFLPVLTWKTMVAQVKHVPKGSFVGYGCTFETKRESRIAVLPVGYYDGYDRAMSNRSQVLIGGIRAPVVGRVCMNMMMVDVTDTADVAVEDEVVLLGRQLDGEISAEEFATWADTINYEVVTRIREGIERRVV